VLERNEERALGKNPTAKQIGDEAVETKSFVELSFSSNG
jgi:hypothetical protein